MYVCVSLSLYLYIYIYIYITGGVRQVLPPDNINNTGVGEENTPLDRRTRRRLLLLLLLLLLLIIIITSSFETPHQGLGSSFCFRIAGRRPPPEDQGNLGLICGIQSCTHYRFHGSMSERYFVRS